MTAWKRGLAFAAWLFALTSMRTAFPELIVWKEIIDAIEQDATGRVWGVVRTRTPLPPWPNPDGTFSEREDWKAPALCTWEGDKWQPVAFHVPAEGGRGSALSRSDFLIGRPIFADQVCE